jgi:hypothetical protein
VCIDVLYGDVLSRRRFVCAPKNVGTDIANCVT